MYCLAAGVGTEAFALLAYQSVVAVIGRLLAFVGARLYVYFYSASSENGTVVDEARSY